MGVTRSFHVVIRDPKPVSVNRLYRSGKHGKRFLSAEGRYFKDAVHQAVVRTTMESENLWTATQDLVYTSGYYAKLHIDLYLESVSNKSWKPGGMTSSGELRSPFRRVDGTNYIKIIEDAVSEGTGIDDSCNMHVCVHKFEDPQDPRVEVRFEVVPNG